MNADHDQRGLWPNGAFAALVLTIDNMGEAADLDRGLWPEAQPIGNHYSVKQVLPQLLAILRKYDIQATYFVEAWNLSVYPSEILEGVIGAGHEVAWHGWRHEAWMRLKDDEAEKANFERSFGDSGRRGFVERNGSRMNADEFYKGFRPPGGVFREHSTLALCRQHSVKYISPAGHQAAIVDVDGGRESIVVLPFRWPTVDAYYYMATFSKLRQLKGELSEAPQTSEVLSQRFISSVDTAIAEGGYLSLLFHPFLNTDRGRLEAFETIVAYLAEKRDAGSIWLARCCDVQAWLKAHPDRFPTDPGLDLTQWR